MTACLSTFLSPSVTPTYFRCIALCAVLNFSSSFFVYLHLLLCPVYLNFSSNFLKEGSKICCRWWMERYHVVLSLIYKHFYKKKKTMLVIQSWPWRKAGCPNDARRPVNELLNMILGTHLSVVLTSWVRKLHGVNGTPTSHWDFQAMTFPEPSLNMKHEVNG